MSRPAPFKFPIGLKLWSGNSDLAPEARKLFERDVFDYVELYIDPKSTDEHVALWKETGLPFRLHAPHSYSGLNLSLSRQQEKNRSLVALVERFRRALDPASVIFHGGIEGSVDETIRQIGIFRKEFPDLFANALIENKPKVGINNENCIGASPREICDIMRATGLGFCLDVGHAICYAHWLKKGWKQLLVEFLYLSPSAFHLSDGDVNSDKDRHDHFGQGNFDLPMILSLIPWSHGLAVETKRDSYQNLDDFYADVVFIKALIEEQSAAGAKTDDVRLREATAQDCEAVYVLANEPEVRRNSFQTEFIPWESHQDWFKKKIEDQHAGRIYLAQTAGGTCLGYVRFDRRDDEAQISIAVDKNHRKKGLGRFLIKRGLDLIAKDWDDVLRVTASVKAENVESQNLFEFLGFAKESRDKQCVYHRPLLQGIRS